MARPRQDVTEAEMAILELLWQNGQASIRQITDALYPDAGPGRYATVQKQLERMEAKRLVRRDRRFFQHLFSAALGREQLAGQRLQTVLDRLCDGSLVPLFSQLARTRPLTPQERQALRELIDETDRPPAPAAPPKRTKGPSRRKE